MEIQYVDKELLTRGNNQVEEEMMQMLSVCSSFDIYCAEEYGVWGVWMEINDIKYQINPLDLFDSIYLDRSCWFLRKYHVSENKKITIDTYKEIYFYVLRHLDESKKIVTIYISFDEYINKIKECLEKLYWAFIHQKPLAYGSRELKIETLNVMLEQINIKAVLPSIYRIMTSDVKEEQFQFNIEEDKYNEGYTIGINNRKYTTNLSHWDNDYDTIRFQLEAFVVNREAKVNLNFDGSCTVVKIKEVNVLEQVSEVGPGYGFKYKGFALVEIHPNEFVNGVIIKGYCNPKHVIKKFYEGLLSLAMNHPIEPDECDGDYSMINAYNKIKSPILERYISDIKVSYEKAELRQIYVKRVLTICPAYDYIIMEADGTVIDVDLSDGRLEELYDEKGNAILIPGLKEWQCEIKPVVIEGAMGRDTSFFDWKNYHKRGLLLAQQLRNELSADFDLWYNAPVEDESGEIPEKMYIYKKDYNR